ncbi:MAG TPA: hypothetical protein PLZ43_13660 [bacterium]|nr:hypothetical protein [bacterium]
MLKKEDFKPVLVTLGIFVFISLISLIYDSLTTDVFDFHPWGFKDYFESMVFHIVKFSIAGITLSFFSNNWKTAVFLAVLLSFYETSGIFISMFSNASYEYDGYFWLLLILPFFITPGAYWLFSKSVINTSKYELLSEKLNSFLNKGGKLFMIKTIFKAFVFYLILVFSSSYFLKSLIEQTLTLKWILEFLMLFATGYFISKICCGNLKKTLLFFAGFNVVSIFTIMLFFSIFLRTITFKISGALYYIIIIPALFAGAYFREFILNRKSSQNSK